MERGPIFIGGPDRCGKTTLRAFLASHPHISIPAVGSNMWTYFYGQFGNLSRPENFERCLTAMLHYKHVAFLQPDGDRVRQEFWQGPQTYARLFALFQQHHAERVGKPRWGDQTGLVERYADQIFEAYPDARVVHMLRDPRDRYVASLALWPHGKGRAGGAAARWLYSAGLAERNLRRYPERYRVVRFETLVERPEATLRELCAFLGEEFVPAMLAMEQAPDHRRKLEQSAGEAGAASFLSPAFIGQYRATLNGREIAFLQHYAGWAMRRHGYELDQVRLSPTDRARLVLLDWPLNLARMVSWRAIEALQHRFPAQIGRRPAQKMRLRHTPA